jgi:hypothetical protein
MWFLDGDVYVHKVYACVRITQSLMTANTRQNMFPILFNLG